MGAGQHAGLLGVGRVKAHAVGGDGVAGGHVNHLAGLQTLALGQGLFEAGGAQTTVQPFGQQGALRSIAGLEAVGQRLEATGAGPSGDCRRRVVKRHARGWRVTGESAHRLQTGDFQGTQAFAQGGLQRAFPTGLHLQSVPQPRHAVQAVLAQPGVEFAVGLDLVLQGLERFESRRQVGVQALLGVDGLLSGFACLVELRHAVLQLLQLGLCNVGLFGGTRELLLQLAELSQIGCVERIAVGVQALAPLLQSAGLLLQAALLGGQHLNLLLHLRHTGALLVGSLLRRAQSVFQGRQLGGLIFGLCGQQDRLLFGLQGLLSQALQFRGGIGAARAPRTQLFDELGQALLHALSAFDHKTDLGLELAHFGAGFVQLALRLVHAIARSVMRLADGLELGLDAAQVGGARLQIGHGLRGLGLDAHLIGLGLGAFQEPELVLLELRIGL